MRVVTLLALAILQAALVGPARAALRVVAATNDLAALANAVGGERVEVDVVARSDRDPHALEVRPDTMRKAARADVYLAVGLSLDLWSADIVRGSRNRNLLVVDCSEAIEPLEVPAGKVDASMGDVHPEGNPHYWLDPRNGAAVARFLAERFAERDPPHAADYAAGAARLAAEIEARLPAWRARLEGGAFVEYHRSWTYLAQRFGMRIAGRVEPLPGIPPSARHLAELAETIRSEQPRVGVRDPYHPDSADEFLARETGMRTIVLPSCCDGPRAEDYLAHFDRIAEALGRPEGAP
jgi:zinc/manganese transport system substrate-binding protein